MARRDVGKTLTDAPWTRLSTMVAEKMGLHFPPERLVDLQRGVAAAAAELGFTDPAACADWLLSATPSKSELDILAAHLTIGETYFFREPKTFEALSAYVLPELIAARRGRTQRIRLWSAACATGEEAYSLAILLHQVLPDIDAWHVTILGSDINGKFLQKAVRATYREWSFRATPASFKDRYFDHVGSGEYRIRAEFKRMVTFEHLNLVSDNYPSLTTDTNAMDVILCRNVLMYFTSAQISRVVSKLRSSLIDGGWLAVSPSEASQTVFEHFLARMFPGVILYQKSEAAHPRRHIGTETAAARTTDERPVVVPPSSSTPSTPLRDESVEPQALAASLYERGLYTQAAATLRESSAVRELDGETFSLLARALANEGNLAEALSCCDRWIAADTLDSGAHYLRAVVLLEQGRAEDARRSLQRALYLEPEFVLAHFALGTLARARARHDEAAKHFANTLRLLNRLRPHDVLRESDGLTAERLTETVRALIAPYPVAGVNRTSDQHEKPPPFT